ncbi:MAG: amidohydrolase [Ruminococcaceae bacterium]|nr:amidohydrolase [Oscillospiraceae bacterium]
MKNSAFFLEEAKRIYPDVVALRRHFHKNPEVSKNEYNTALKIEEELDKLGLPHTRVGETGVCSEIDGELPGDRTIILRADIDALPIKEEHICSYTSTDDGVMHACGHDAHTASLLGGARILAENRHLFGGKVKLHFQQAEEVGYGARVFINEGLVKGDRCFGIHVTPHHNVGKIVLTPGPLNASVDWFKISVTGKSAHVSRPHLGVDAAYIAAQILISLQAIVTRTTDPMENLLIGVGKISAGTAYNIVAENAELEGTLRALTPDTRANTKKRIEAIARSVAESFGGNVFIEWKDYTSPLINDEIPCKEAWAVAEELFGENNVVKFCTPSLGGDDFAEYILKVPGVYANVGSCNPDIYETTVAMHNCKFDIDEKCLITGSAIYAAYASAFLNKEV